MKVVITQKINNQEFNKDDLKFLQELTLLNLKNKFKRILKSNTKVLVLKTTKEQANKIQEYIKMYYPKMDKFTVEIYD